MPMDTKTRLNSGVARLREDVLRDSRHPVHQIAEELLPYLRILVGQFDPEQVILFGSYAYGSPDEDSDVDLCVIKRMNRGPVSEATEVRRAVRHLRRSGANLPLDIMVRDPADMARRVANGDQMHKLIMEQGLRLA